MRTNPLSHFLRMAALSAALLAGGAATALADVPGSYFPDEWRPKPVPMQVAQVAAQNNCSMADAGTPALSATLGRMARNHLSPGAAYARSAG
jgi:hypothetical protein